MKRIKYSRFFILLISIGFLLVTVACGSDKDRTTGATDNNGNNEAKEVELTMMTNWSGPLPQDEIMKARVEAFEKENPNIKIKLEAVATEQYMTKLRTLATGKELPDIFQAWPGAELEPLVEADLVLPLEEDFVKKLESTIISPDFFKDYEVDDEKYAVPVLVAYTSVIYYNKELFAEAGYDGMPKTYSEFKQLITDLRDKDITPIALGNKPKWPLQSSYLSVISDRLTGGEFLQQVLNGESKFTDPEFVQALTVIEELVELDAFNSDMNTVDNAQIQDYFIQGKVAMIIDGSWADGKVRVENPNGNNVGIALFPAIEGGKGTPNITSGTSNDGLALNSELSGAKKEAAFKFLEFFHSKEFYEEMLTVQLTPTIIDVPDNVDDSILEIMELTSGGGAPVLDAIVPIPVINVLEDGLQGITLGKVKPEDLAEEMQKVLEE